MNMANAPADPYFPAYGDRTYSVEHYELGLDYSLESNQLTARAVIDAVAVTDLDQLRLDLHELKVTKVSVEGNRVAKFSQSKGRLVVRFANRIPHGRPFRLRIGYGGRPKPVPDGDDEMGWEELADGVIVAGQTHGAPSWFPCNDRPDDKASYRIKVTVPNAYHVVANGTLVERRRGAGASTWEYDQPEPMAAYLATVHIGRYVERRLESSVPMSVVLPQSGLDRLSDAFGRQPEMMALFERLYGPYPFARYTAVVTEDELEIPLEAQSLSAFGSNFLTDDWDSVRLVAHELCHQWFGNSLTVASWRDIWLHEGFACYSEWLWSEESGGPSADERAAEHWKRLDDLPQDLLLGDPGPDDMFDDRVYKRGALLLHTLRRTVGDESFFTVLRTWADRRQHSTVTTKLFVALTAELSGEDLGDVFDAWLNETALPPLPG